MGKPTKAEIKRQRAAEARAALAALDSGPQSTSGPAEPERRAVPDPDLGKAKNGKASCKAAPVPVREHVDDHARDASGDGNIPVPAPQPVVAHKAVLGNHGGEIPRSDPDQIPERMFPGYPAGTFKRGDSVWYLGERYWIIQIPDTWTKGCFARLSNQMVHPDPDRPLHVDNNTESFCVHASLLTAAPVAKRLYDKQPTQAVLAQKERAAKGLRDVGDDVATMLRTCETLDHVYAAAAKYLEQQVGDLKAKYEHLNPGQQRMVLGNRMRAKWKKENGNG